MRRVARAAAWLVLIVLTALGPFWAASSAVSREARVRRPYDSWTGVLRLWKCEGWESGGGTLTTWLNECIAAFEKRHPGVYIQIADVSEETLRAFPDGEINPPDMILYAPGMLDAPYSLMPIKDALPLRQPLDETGFWQDTRYAVPVALGGYGLAIDSGLISETPSDWSELTLDEANSGKKTTWLLNVPMDGRANSWSAALISLFSGSFSVQRDYEQPLVGEGIDLGLATAEPERTKAPDEEMEEWLPNALPSSLAEEFREKDSVYAQFTAGEIAVMPVTQREIRRLQLLSDSGRATDWRVECIGFPFTDQIALFSIVEWPREDIEARQMLAKEFMKLILSEEMQRKLTMVRTFSVLDGEKLYINSMGLDVVEVALGRPDLLLPPTFGREWRAYAEKLADGLQAGEGTQEAYRLLESMMSGG